MNIGSAIKKARSRRGMRQKELAAAAGITQAYPSQIENNKREPNLGTLRSISEHLEIPFPILSFLSLDQGDVPEEKREAYKMIYPQMVNLIEVMLDESVGLKKMTHG